MSLRRYFIIYCFSMFKNPNRRNWCNSALCRFSCMNCLWNTERKDIWKSLCNVVFHPIITQKVSQITSPNWSCNHLIVVTKIRTLQKAKGQNKETGDITEQKMIIVQDTYTCPDGWHISDIGDEVQIVRCLILFLTIWNWSQMKPLGMGSNNQNGI